MRYGKRTRRLNGVDWLEKRTDGRRNGWREGSTDEVRDDRRDKRTE